ncbi:WD40 repeat [Actinosynnema pretiosum]|nr:WD40 repeat [Actinosynnema pretiosum]
MFYGARELFDGEWWETGAEADLAAFLRTGSGLLLVVTGEAGESAAVARAGALADPEFRASPWGRVVVADAPEEVLPPLGSVDVVVPLRTTPSSLALARVAHGLGVDSDVWRGERDVVSRLHWRLADRLAATGPVTVVLNGVDVAADPFRVAVDVVGPLLRLGARVVLAGAEDALSRLPLRFRAPTTRSRAAAPRRAQVSAGDAEELAVLRAAALARGRGVPRELWAAMASAVADAPVPEAAVERVVGRADLLVERLGWGGSEHRPAHEGPARLAGFDVVAAHRRIAERLLAPEPHDYVRMHLVEHAVLGNVVDDAHLPAWFLPWSTPGSVRAALGVPPPPDAELLDWARVEPLVRSVGPRGGEIALDLARAARNLPPLVVGGPRVLTGTPELAAVRWARWHRPDNVLAEARHWSIAPRGGAREGSPASARPARATWSAPLVPLVAGDGGPLLAVLREWEAVALLDVTTGEWSGTGLGSPDEPVSAIAPVPVDGRDLVATALAGSVRLWDPDTCERVGPELAVDGCSGMAAAGGLLACATGRGLELWDVVAGERVRVVDGACRDVVALGARLLGVLDADGSARVLDPAGAVVGRVPGAWSRVVAVPFAGRTLLACGDDRDVRLWDPAGEGAALTGAGRVEAAVPLPDGRVLLACAAPGLREVRLVDAVTGEVVASCGELVADLLAVATVPLPDGRALLVTGDGDALRAWDPVGPGPVVPAEDVVRVAPLPERGLLAVGHRDGTVLLRDARTGEQVGAPLSAEVGETLWSMVVVPASEGRVLLAAKAGDVAVELLDVDTGLRARLLLPAGEDRGTDRLVPVPVADGRTLLATVSRDVVVRLWDVDTGEVLARFDPGHGGLCATAAFDGLLLTSGPDGLVRFWDPLTGEPAREPAEWGPPTREHEWDPAELVTGAGPSGVTAMTGVRLDGRLLLACACDGVVAATGELVRERGRFPDWVHDLVAAPMPDGRVVLAAVEDPEARLWDLASDHVLRFPVPPSSHGLGALTSDGAALLVVGTPALTAVLELR